MGRQLHPLPGTHQQLSLHTQLSRRGADAAAGLGRVVTEATLVAVQRDAKGTQLITWKKWKFGSARWSVFVVNYMVIVACL